MRPLRVKRIALEVGLVLRYKGKYSLMGDSMLMLWAQHADNTHINGESYILIGSNT